LASARPDRDYFRVDETLYPELAGRGLSAALRAELAALGSDVEPSWDPPLALWSHAARGSRSGEAYAAADERSFGLDLWAEGVEYLSGWSSDLGEVAAAIDLWLADADAETTAERFAFLALNEFARAYDRGDAIEIRWRSYLGQPPDEQPLLELIAAAAGEPRLRRLFPYTSMDALMFSRWVGYPFSDDLPSARRVDVPSTYVVSDATGRPLGEGGAARAVELLAGALPDSLEVVYRRPASQPD
jgi:Family of unknown function (DUF6193)